MKKIPWKKSWHEIADVHTLSIISCWRSKRHLFQTWPIVQMMSKRKNGSKNGPYMRDRFPGIPEAFSRETGKPKIRDFPGIPVPGIPGSKHYWWMGWGYLLKHACFLAVWLKTEPFKNSEFQKTQTNITKTQQIFYKNSECRKLMKSNFKLRYC